MAHGWHLVRRPEGTPNPATDFALRELPARALGEGEVRIANRFLSVDPYMRGRMSDVKSYVPPFALDRPMEGGAIGEVVESRAEAVPTGTLVSHMAGWRDEAVIPAAAAQPLPGAAALPLSNWLGVMGMPGMTAWFGLLDVGALKAGDTVFVSAAAGAVGSAVVQIAKARGATVIGSAGGDEKCALVRELGADAMIDYKAAGDRIDRALRQAAPDGIDIYFDNVGGAHLDGALASSRDRARFAICGMIEVYNDGRSTTLRYLPQIIRNRIAIRGFIVSDFMSRMSEFQAGMGALVGTGKVRALETITDGLEAMPDAFLGLFSGANTGKAVVRI